MDSDLCNARVANNRSRVLELAERFPLYFPFFFLLGNEGNSLN